MRGQVLIVAGENIFIDGDMPRNMIYHNDNGWRLGKWMR